MHDNFLILDLIYTTNYNIIFLLLAITILHGATAGTCTCSLIPRPLPRRHVICTIDICSCCCMIYMYTQLPYLVRNVPQSEQFVVRGSDKEVRRRMDSQAPKFTLTMTLD